MRKRVVIVLVALAIAGGIAALVFRPWESQLQYHKRKYLAARERIAQQPLWERTASQLSAATGLPFSPDAGRHRKTFERHQEELIRLGYLERREFTFTHGAGTRGFVALNRAAVSKSIPIARGRFAVMTGTVSNIVILTAPREDMPVWAELLRQADVPENGK